MKADFFGAGATAGLSSTVSCRMHCWASQQWRPTEQVEERRGIFCGDVSREEGLAEPFSKGFYVILAL